MKKKYDIIWGSAYDRNTLTRKKFVRKPARGRIVKLKLPGDSERYNYFIPLKDGTLELDPSKPIPMNLCLVADNKADAVSLFNRTVMKDIVALQKEQQGCFLHQFRFEECQKEILEAYDELILDPVKELEIPTKYGRIRAMDLGDDEYPGISLCYSSAGNGEPGVVLQYDKADNKAEGENVRLLVWDPETVDQDPKYDIVLSEKPKDSVFDLILATRPAPILVEMPELPKNVDKNIAFRFVNELLKEVYPNRTITLFSHNWEAVVDIGQAAWSVCPGMGKDIEYLELFKPTKAFTSVLNCLAKDYHCSIKQIPLPNVAKDMVDRSARKTGQDPQLALKVYHRSGLCSLNLAAVMHALYACTRTYEVVSDALYIVAALYEPSPLDMELFLQTPEKVQSVQEVETENSPLPDYIGDVRYVLRVFGMPTEWEGIAKEYGKISLKNAQNKP